jgi:hypothetical protein
VEAALRIGAEYAAQVHVRLGAILNVVETVG